MPALDRVDEPSTLAVVRSAHCLRWPKSSVPRAESPASTQHEMDDLLGELDIAKSAEYIASFANLYIEMIAETA